jgi:hypothetical protein
MGFTYVYPTDFDNNFTYNPLNYSVNNQDITAEYLVSHFLQITGGSLTGNLNLVNGANYYLNSSLLDFSALSGLTPGTVTASKLVQVDANKDIASFRNLTATGNLICNSNGNFICNNSSNTNTGIFYNNNNTTTAQGQFVGNWASSNYWGFGNNSTSSDNTVKLGIVTSSSTGAWATSGTTLANLNIGGLLLNSSTVNSTATELNYLSGVTPGVSQANTALVTGPFNNISGLFNISATGLAGDLIAPTQITVTSGNITCTGATPLSLRNVSSARGLDITVQSSGTYNADIKLINDQATALLSLYSNGSRQISLINNANNVNFPNHNGSTTGIQLAGTLVTASATKLNYCDISTLGTCQASKCVTTDASLNITGLNNINNTGSITTTINNNTTSLVTYQQWINSLASPMTVQLLMSNIAPKFGTLNAYDFRLMTNNTTAMWISQSNQFCSIGTGTASYKLEVQTGDCNLTSGVYRVAGNDISTPITGLTLGLAAASKVLSCDSSLNVTGVNKFLISNTGSTVWANNSVQSSYGLCVNASVGTSIDALGSALAFACDNAVNTVPGAAIHCNKFSSTGTDMSIALRNGANLRDAIKIQNTGNLIVNSTSATLGAGGWITTASDGSSFPDGSYCRHIVCRNNNVDVISFQIEILEGSGLTTTNGTFIGNITQNDLKLGVNNSTKMTISSATATSGYVGIGTSSPVVPLDVSTSGTSRSFDVGGLGYGQLSKTTTTFSIGPVTTNITAQFSNSVLLSTGSYYTISDQRIKKNFTEIKDTTSFIRNVNPCLFEYRNDSGQKYLGYKAQDVARESIELINFIDNPNMKVEGEGDIEGVQLSVDYTKVCCLLHKAMQVLLDRVDELESQLKKLS